MKTRNEIIEAHKQKYQTATKKEKTDILNTVCNATGLSRNRTTRLLCGSAKTNNKFNKKENRGRKKTYDETLIVTIEKIWKLADFACGKRLKEAMPLFIDALQRHDELILDPQISDKLITMSAATIDRLLVKSKARLSIKGKTTTKPGTLLKKNIPLRLGFAWDDAKPGFVEIDLVAHCGETTSGSYVNTLDVTDVCTGWTENRAVINKAERHVFKALMTIQDQVPFKYLGIDSDNGAEFINQQLYRYCLTNNICFTRSRPYKKNDGCYVEQKNWQIIRRNIGYDRYEGLKAVELLNHYYELLRLYTNFFLPQTKLIEKKRIGSKIVKKYEIPKTPYQRILESEHIEIEVKNQLKELFLTLNPAHLTTRMECLLKELGKLAITQKLGFEQKTSPKGFALMLGENGV